MVDMAVGIVIGAAFGTIITSLVSDIIMPPIGLLLGNVDFSGLFMVLKEGRFPHRMPALPMPSSRCCHAELWSFINTIVSFLIVALRSFWW